MGRARGYPRLRLPEVARRRELQLGADDTRAGAEVHGGGGGDERGGDVGEERHLGWVGADDLRYAPPQRRDLLPPRPVPGGGAELPPETQVLPHRRGDAAGGGGPRARGQGGRGRGGGERG